MKKKLLFAAGAVLLASAVSAFVCVNKENNSIDGLFDDSIEALASCEISKGDTIKYLCSGNNGKCTITYMGFTLTCDGEEVK